VALDVDARVSIGLDAVTREPISANFAAISRACLRPLLGEPHDEMLLGRQFVQLASKVALLLLLLKFNMAQMNW
jgi:hypothetical protein